MRTKTLITSVLLGLIAVVLLGYVIVGCSSRLESTSERAAGNSDDSAIWSAAGREPATESPTSELEPQREAAIRYYEQPRTDEDVANQPQTSSDSVVVHDGMATVTSPIENRDPVRFNVTSRERNSAHEEAGSKAVTGPVPVLGDLPIAGELLGRDTSELKYDRKVDYGWRGNDQTVPIAGGFGGGMLEGTRVSGRDNVNVLGIAPGKPSQLPSVNRASVELFNVSADEIWVIAKSETQAVPRGEETPGCGAMLAKLPKEDKEIPLPLKHTDVKGQISGYIATVDVTQQFHNPYDEKIEAEYVFPLPQNAAINEFIMTIGERRIRGIIRERKEAEEIYRQARSQGYVASLLTQERPNIFTQKVANIEPGKAIDVNIKYFNTLAYVDGWYEFVFPMVVGPRFNPPCSTEGVGAVARGKPGISGQRTEVQYLKPGERSGHDISLAVDIDAGVTIEQVACSSHVITNSSATRERRTVKLSSLDSIPNKDFVLRYKVAGKTVKSALVTHRDERGGFFTLMLYPPENLSYLKRAPMEMIFVLDCSGSMNGKPIAKAKEAITRALKKLEPDDTFQVIRFSNNASQLGPNPLPATPENIRKGLSYVESLHGSGGT
ncbi:MAG: VIT domain-containing protein, partial [Planctomycetota bacterium]